MNKKRFLNLAVCSLLVAGMPVAVTSCKDYDDDITSINTTTDGLSKQLQSLQTELTAAKDAAAAAANDVKAAQKAADEAKAEAAAATKAAAEAKAAAIQAAMDEVKKLQASITSLNTLTDEQAQQLAALAGKIEGIEKGLSNIDLADVNKKIGEHAAAIVEINTKLQAIETQQTALDNLRKELAALTGDFKGLSDRVTAIEGLAGELTTLKDTVKGQAADILANKKAIADVKTEIEDITGQLKTLSAKISTEVNNAVNTIAATITQRLTSVTLIPDTYVGGIPTIEFESAKYVKQKWTQAKGWHDVDANVAKRVFIIHNNSAEAQYRLNPGTITENDIKLLDMKYVSQVATTRAAEVENDIVNVAGATVGSNGRLIVKLGKSTTESLNFDDPNTINTVSLKVPIADKHLFTEQGETEASVYSEYTRLEETYFQPELAYKPGSYIGTASHPQDSLYYCVSSGAGYAAGEGIVKNIVYNKPFNLYDLVGGCKFYAPDKHKFLSIDEVRAYGMEIKFHVANITYAPTTDKTNQQVFAKIPKYEEGNNNILTPVSVSGQQGNQVIIGKQPIIAATLIDVTNNNVIQQRYFKVCFTAEDMDDVKIDWQDIATTGKLCTGASFDFTWSEMGKRVLEGLNNGKGMSEKDFAKIYGKTAPVIAPANDQNGTLVANVVYDPSTSLPVMTWTLTPEQLVNYAKSRKLTVGDNTITVTKTVTFTDSLGLHPNVVMNLKWVVTVKVDKVDLGTADALKWKNNTMKVYPVPMAVPYDGKTASYMTNILEGRNKPYVKGLASCGKYDINYAVSGNPAYHGEDLILQSGYSHWGFTTANQANLTTINYTIANTRAGQQLIAGSKVIKIDWSNDINGFAANRYVFGTTNLQFVPILKLDPVLSEGFVDNSRQQTLNIGDKYTLTDAYGHLVAATNPANAQGEDQYAADRYKYYGVEKADFSGEIMVADDVEGKVNSRSLASLNMSADVDNATGVLTFQNNGSPLQADAYLIVPIKVKHLWGSYDDTMLKGHIAVPIKKALKR